MPCYMVNIPANVKPLVKDRQKGKQPTKAEAKAGLKEALRQGLISPAKYQELAAKVDACVEEKGYHTHGEEEHVHN